MVLISTRPCWILPKTRLAFVRCIRIPPSRVVVSAA